MNQRLERQGNGGRCPPNPLGFIAWRQKRWLGLRTRDECPACRRALASFAFGRRPGAPVASPQSRILQPTG
jgi:hypothetical protein